MAPRHLQKHADRTPVEEERPPTKGGPETEEGPLARETIFFALSNRRRRYVLRYLEQRGKPVRLRELTEQVAAWENGIEVIDVRRNDRKTVYTSLLQTHLPTLAKAGIVTYSETMDDIATTERIEELDVYLDLNASDQQTWSHRYLGLAVGMTALVAAVAFDVPPFALVPDLVVAFIIAGALLLSAGVHFYYAS